MRNGLVYIHCYISTNLLPLLSNLLPWSKRRNMARVGRLWPLSITTFNNPRRKCNNRIVTKQWACASCKSAPPSCADVACNRNNARRRYITNRARRTYCITLPAPCVNIPVMYRLLIGSICPTGGLSHTPYALEHIHTNTRKQTFEHCL